MDIRPHKQNIALSRFYLAEKSCHMNFEEEKIIVPCNNLHEVKTRESVEITAHKNKFFNDNLF